MELARIAVYSLLVVIVGLLVFFLFQDWRRKKREIFASNIKSMISFVIDESCREWGSTASQRWWLIQREEHLKKIRSNYFDCEECIGYCIISDKKWEGCRKLDFSGENAIEYFLARLLEEVVDYGEQRERAVRDFVKIEAFSGPRDVFLSINGNKCTFLFFDTFNFCTFAEVIVEIKQIDWALNKSQSERLETDFGVGVILAKFEGSYVGMQFCTPRGWLMASLCREDFERAYAKAQKS